MKYIKKRIIASAAAVAVTVSLMPVCGSTDSVRAEAAGKSSPAEITAEDYGIKTYKNGSHINQLFTDSEGNTISSGIPGSISDARDTGKAHAGKFSSVNTIKRSAKVKKGLKKSGTSSSEALPSHYDSRDKGIITDVRNQGIGGTCWSFAALKAVEASAVSDGILKKDADLSESHLIWNAYTKADGTDHLYGDSTTVSNRENPSSDDPFYGGGNSWKVISVLARGSGVQFEKNFPYDGSSRLAIEKMAEENATKGNGERYTSGAYLKNADLLGNSMTDIKNAIIRCGAVSASMYYEENGKDYISTSESGDTAYYENYVQSSKDAGQYSNHDIAIIGWDDDYSSGNFKSRPDGNGAWLAVNSYGAEHGGFFWISYYDKSLTGAVSYKMEPADKAERIYQYDGTGYGGAVSLASADGDKDFYVDTANVYTAAGNDTLSQVGFYTIAASQKYKVTVYAAPSSGGDGINKISDNPSEGEVLSEAEGTEKFPGYHVVDLSKSVKLRKGDDFSVSVRYYAAEGGHGTAAYVPDEGKSTVSSEGDYTFTSEKSSEKAQSYFRYKIDYTDGSCSDSEWVDQKNADKSGPFEGKSTVINNFCIKAIAQPEIEDESEKSSGDLISTSEYDGERSAATDVKKVDEPQPDVSEASEKVSGSPEKSQETSSEITPGINEKSGTAVEASGSADTGKSASEASESIGKNEPAAGASEGTDTGRFDSETSESAGKSGSADGASENTNGSEASQETSESTDESRAASGTSENTGKDKSASEASENTGKSESPAEASEFTSHSPSSDEKIDAGKNSSHEDTENKGENADENADLKQNYSLSSESKAGTASTGNSNLKASGTSASRGSGTADSGKVKKFGRLSAGKVYRIKGNRYRVLSVHSEYTNKVLKSRSAVLSLEKYTGKGSSTSIENFTYKNIKCEVTEISALAFKSAGGLKKITLGESVKSIGWQAFKGARSLRSITLKSTDITGKTLAAGAFSLNRKVKIYVPTDSFASYAKLIKSHGGQKAVAVKS